MDTTWVFEKEVRGVLGERTLPEWKRWLRDNDVSLRPLLEKHYDGDLQDDLQRMRIGKIDEWLFDFVQSPQGLQVARMITPEHPALEPTEPYDPTEAFLKAGPVAIGGAVLQAKERESIVGANHAPPPKDLFRRGYEKKAKLEGMTLEQLGSALEFEVNSREQLFAYLKDRKQVDPDALPQRSFSASSKIALCDSGGLRPELFLDGSAPFRIIEEKENTTIDWGGREAIRILHRLKDVTGNTLDYGQAEVVRQTYEADAVFIIDES